MSYSSNSLAALLLARRLTTPDQVANGPDTGMNLTPVTEVSADAVRAAWLPVQPGQAIPMIGERIYAESDDDS